MTQERASNMQASRHEPECGYKPENVDWDKGIQWGGRPCICQKLESAYLRGYLAALDEARKAVATADVRKDTSYEMRMQALAVIEALREKP